MISPHVEQWLLEHAEDLKAAFIAENMDEFYEWVKEQYDEENDLCDSPTTNGNSEV
jgi:hypothetical protein